MAKRDYYEVLGVNKDASDEDLASLFQKTERYCTVLQTLTTPPPIESELVRA